MKKITVYRITPRNYGHSVTFHPHVPLHPMPDEDTEIERISVCTSIPACLYAMPHTNAMQRNKKQNLYIYTADVPAESLMSPNLAYLDHAVVPDAWKTGELWLGDPTKFYKLGDYVFRKQLEIEGTTYSRYEMTTNPVEGICDWKTGNIVYGDIDCFSILLRDEVKANLMLWE